MTRRRAGALIGCLLIAGVLATPAAPSSAAAVSPAASAAAGFLEREFARLGHSYPAPGSSNADGGLVADALIGLHAAGATRGEFAAATAKLREAYFSGAVTTSGTVAKYLMVATRAGVDPAGWGTDSLGKPIDLVQRLTATLDDNGRYRNLNAGAYDPRRDVSNVFSQSLSMIALHERGGTGGAGKALDYLLRQQCPSGGFRAAPKHTDPASRCDGDDSLVGVDYTAMAAWALAETKGSPGALARAVSWLRTKQLADGSFKNGDGAASANSTGLAALALTRAGDAVNAERANGWLVSLQLPPGGAVPAMAGAVAASADAYLAIQRDPAGFWAGAGQQDQLRRASAQAILGLSAAPVGDVPPPPVSPPDPDPTEPDPDPAEPNPGPAEPGSGSAGPNPGSAAADSGGFEAPPATGSASGSSPPATASTAPPGPRPPLAAPPVTPVVPQPDPAPKLVALGGAAALPPREADFVDFLRGPWGIAASVLTGFAVAAAGYWLVTRRNQLPGAAG